MAKTKRNVTPSAAEPQAARKSQNLNWVRCSLLAIPTLSIRHVWRQQEEEEEESIEIAANLQGSKALCVCVCELRQRVKVNDDAIKLN